MGIRMFFHVFVALQLGAAALDKSATLTISQRGSVRSDGSQTKRRLVRREEAEALAPSSAEMGAGLRQSIGHYVKADVNSLVCPDGNSRVDEVHVCEASAAVLQATNNAKTEIHSTLLPHGCFAQNNSVFYNHVGGLCLNGTASPTGKCPDFQLVCSKTDDDGALTPFDKTDGACHCAMPGKTKEMERNEDSIAQCAVLCSAVDACDAFEVDSSFSAPGRCTIYTGTCSYNATSDEASESMECYLRKEREAGHSANPTPGDAAATTALLDDAPTFTKLHNSQDHVTQGSFEETTPDSETTGSISLLTSASFKK